ncbi:MAG TPA: tRNA (adenosine(37)-N6)-dimethylallyltransferase MiaA [Planctomycetota bacterium]
MLRSWPLESAPRAFLLGPTAAGKTAVAIALARHLPLEVLTLDSMQVYQGMDIGTAKPGPAERGAVAHHLLDLVPPDQEFSVARWLDAAHRTEAEVRARGRLPLYVGGTGLYLKALTAGLLAGPSVPAEVRAAVASELAANGREALRAELRHGDPELHARLHPNDDKRLLRGVEILRACGRPLTALQQQWREGARIGAPAVAIEWPRERLRERVAERFDAMLESGLLEEVARLRTDPGFGAAAGKALGYRQLIEHLDGECTLQEAVARAVTLTRTLIRRQMTWLRSFPDLQWAVVGSTDAAEVVAAGIADRLLSAAR